MNLMNVGRILLVLFISLVNHLAIYAQHDQRVVNLDLENGKWILETGEVANFIVKLSADSLKSVNKQLVVKYKIGKEGIGPFKEDTIIVNGDEIVIERHPSLTGIP